MEEQAGGKTMLYVRVDADAGMGVGHLMRCLALAQEWQAQGGRVVFVSHLGAQKLGERVRNSGFGLLEVAQKYPDPHDLWSTREFMQGAMREAGEPLWCVMDGYHFDPAYQAAIRATGCKVLMIDDMALQARYEADILVNQNMGAEGLRYAVAADTILLLGSRYVMLRQEFREKMPGRRKTPPQARRILVTLGGADPQNVTQTVLKALAQMGRDDLEVKVVVGPVNPHWTALQDAAAKVRFDCELVRTPQDMPSLMRWADVAISAAGSTCWELNFMGVPCAVTIVAKNQEGVARHLAAAGAAIDLGWWRDLQESALACTLADFFDDQERRQALIDNGQGLVDGRGAERIIRAMRALDFHLRPAVEDDCQSLFAWANDPLARQASFCRRAIGWDEHCAWFHDKLADGNCHLYVAVSAAGERMGLARFAMEGGRAIISVNLGPEFRGLGLGSRLIRQACQRWLAETKAKTPIHALIRKENTASRSAFERAGFGAVLDVTDQEGVPAILLAYLGERQ